MPCPPLPLGQLTCVLILLLQHFASSVLWAALQLHLSRVFFLPSFSMLGFVRVRFVGGQSDSRGA